MKKTVLLIIICGASAATLVISGCGKKNNSSGVTMKSLAGTYKLTAATVTYSGATVDGLQFFDDCQKDDLYQFNADSTFIYTDAGVKCTPDGSSTATWYLSGNYLIQGTDSATIKSFNGKALVLTGAGDIGGVPATTTTTLTKQ